MAPPKRGHRPANRKALRAAVRAWAAAQYQARTGLSWTAVDAAIVREDTAEPAARGAWLAIETAIVAAREWLASHPRESDGYALRLRAAVTALPHVTQAEPRTAWTLRGAIVAEYGRAGHWWWRTRPPKARDLAILSLLAGAWPEQRGPVAEQHALATPLDVVRAEERAMRQAMRRV